MNLNTLAERIARLEGGKVNLSIAQVKEVMRHVLDEMARRKPTDVMLLLRKRKDRLCRTAKK